jgi:hypothetical protein
MTISLPEGAVVAGEGVPSEGASGAVDDGGDVTPVEWPAGDDGEGAWEALRGW